MRFFVYVLEAKDLPVSDSYVKLRIGKFMYKTRVLRNTVNPVWNEKFVFRVHDLDDELFVSVNLSDDLVGRVRIPLLSVVDVDNQTLPPTWFELENPFRSGKFVSEDCGKILLTLSLHGRSNGCLTKDIIGSHSPIKTGDLKEDPYVICQDDYSSKEFSPKAQEEKHLMKTIANKLEIFFKKRDEAAKTDESSEISSLESDHDDCMEEAPSISSFEDAIEMMQCRDDEQEMLENLPGGVLLNQTYLLPPNDLNKFLFSPNSQFPKNLAELQGTTDITEGPWMWKSGNMSCLTRVVTYTKAASKIVKAVKATEEQNFIKASGTEFAVFITVSTPEVPYGHSFKVELLYKISPGPELPSREESSRLVISWNVNFSQSTMLKGMIEGGVKQGLKESFHQFAGLLGQNLKVLNSSDTLDKDQMLTNLHPEPQSDWELACKYFCNPTVISAALMTLFVAVHIFLCRPREPQGLEFDYIDLPDSLGELITGGILFIQLERAFNMVSHFVQARLQRGSDHGVKAQGDGWVLTVALIEGINLSYLDSTGSSDPYVVFTCNGKTRTSSVKLQTHDPQWNEILEFDAMDEPPSVLDVEVFDFDGPFDQATSLGHVEINFLKHTSAELADMWVSLEGKRAQYSQSKLHLRIFLDNNNGVDTIKEYLTKMEKEVGKKLNMRSPHRNSTFQKLFELPPEEFLINDYACSLRRKMPLRGRLFLSSRIVGFYANLFGHKTKFFFLWEDIEDIQVRPPSLGSVGSPSLVMVLRKGRGHDARHGAKSQDEHGRLKFYFHSFISLNTANRTIMATWRSRTINPDNNSPEVYDNQDLDDRSLLIEDACYVENVDDLEMSKVYSAEIPFNIKAVMKMFDGGELEYVVMGKSGCLNYVTTNWENIKPDLFERRVCYKFNRHISMFGGEVTCTQHKIPIADEQGWIVTEIMALHNVPFSDNFRINFRYQFEKSILAEAACKCDVYMRVTWLKSSKFQQRITRNIIEKFTNRSKELFELIVRDFTGNSDQIEV